MMLPVLLQVNPGAEPEQEQRQSSNIRETMAKEYTVYGPEAHNLHARHDVGPRNVDRQEWRAGFRPAGLTTTY